MTEDSKRLQDVEKARAAEYAAGLVESGMMLGLGTGTTVGFLLERIAERLRAGELRNIRAVCTSRRTEQHAGRAGIPFGNSFADGSIDLYIDGADEVNPEGALIKGGGGALLREKMVAIAARRRVIIADSAKLVETLGLAFKLPVEIVRFGYEATLERIAAAGGCEPEIRLGADGVPMLSDEEHYIADCRFPRGIANPSGMDIRLKSITGVVDTGLFIGLCGLLVVGHADAPVETRTFSSNPVPEIKRT